MIEKKADLKGRSKEGERLDEVLEHYLADDEMMMHCPLQAEQIEELRVKALENRGKYFRQDIAAIAEKIVNLIKSIKFREEDMYLRPDRYAARSNKDHYSLPDTIKKLKENKAKIKSDLNHLEAAWLKCSNNGRLLECFEKNVREKVVSYFMKGVSPDGWGEEPDRESLKKLSLIKIKEKPNEAQVSEESWSPFYQLQEQEEKIKRNNPLIFNLSSGTSSKIDQLLLKTNKYPESLTQARPSIDASSRIDELTLRVPEDLTQARSFAKQENEKVVTQEQGISKVAVNINKPVKKEAINESQKKLIAERLEFVFANIRKIEIASVALKVIELISKEIEFNEKEEAFLKQHDCLEGVSFIRKIFAHPYPQNREVGDSSTGMGPEGIEDERVYFWSNGVLISTPQGLLSLTILNNYNTLPITKKAVIGYVEHLIRKEKELLEEREKQASK